MMKKIALFSLLAFLFLAACEDVGPEVIPEPEATELPSTETEQTTADSESGVEEPTTEPAPDPAAGSGSGAEGVLFSEVLIGAPGDNNREFIEFYNAGDLALNLDGYSLWYRLDDGQEPQQVYTWHGRAEAPPLGHFLLVREGQDFGLIPDGYFDVPLSQRKGGLVLRDAAGQDVAVFGWGEAPPDFVAGSGAAVPGDGASMERLPGGDVGHSQDSGDNAADFVANDSPNPQNSGSPATPLAGEHLEVILQAPETVQPGVEFDLILTVTNQGSATAENIEIGLPIVETFAVVQVPEGAEEVSGLLTWTLPNLGAEESMQAAVTLQSPFTYVDTIFSGAYAQAEGGLPDYGAPQLTTMAGGAIPVATARELLDSTVSIEGIATMYTGGFFAGSGTKFYLQDESGGIQVYAPNGGGVLDVQIGDRVRVTGDIELYRDSIELVPGDFNVDVEVLEEAADDVEPVPITPLDNENSDEVLGRLNRIEGTATRIEEFTYSFEIDLMDDDGNETLVYIDKDSRVTAEPLEVGEQYRISGISEFYSSEKRLMPRLQSDIVQIFPPVLLLDVRTANDAQPGEILTYVISATNHTAEPLTNVQISAPVPAGTTLAQISAGGSAGLEDVVDGSQVNWTLDEIAGDGGLAVVSFNVRVDDERTEPLALGAVSATAEQWPETAQTEPLLTFMGETVPIWAIQGPGERSPYVLSDRATQGVVTGVFPELGGFWIQELETDDDPATSAGLFVLFGDGDAAELPVLEGDLVQVDGRVREISGQTTLQVSGGEDILLLDEEQLLPTPQDFDPPQEDETAQIYKESLEGMLVALPGTGVVVAPTSQYGEYTLVNESWGVDSVRRGEATGFLIAVDDGSSTVHGDNSTLPYVVNKGDRVTDLVGPLAFTFEQFKIEPLTRPAVESSEREIPILEPAGENQFSVATFNVENFFDTRDPHPSSPPRPSRDEYENKLAKIGAAIEGMGAPHIIGLQEVENIGVLEDLAALDALSPYAYEGHLIEGPDARGIDVAYLVRGDRVSIESVEAFPEPTGLTTRPPLLIKAVIELESGPQTVYVTNNHLSSLASGEAATEPRRTGQAAWNLEIIDGVLAEDPEAQFIVLGDLNSFLGTPPLDVLQEAGLRHAYEFFTDEADFPYTYIFQGSTQTLDHILMSEELFGRVSDVSTLAINADYAIGPADDESPLRVSDHDPLVVVFTVEE